MRKMILILAVAAGAFAIAAYFWPAGPTATIVASSGPDTDPAWPSHSYWYDGTAELNFYSAAIAKYGQPRQTDEVVHILVTEDHNPQLLVKADDWRSPGNVKMLKLNLQRTFRTGIYEYREMMTAYFDHNRRSFAKMTFASQEWCGSSFKEVVNYEGRSSYHFNTYWDGQGNGSYEVEFPSDMVPYDSLPAYLRMLDWNVGLKGDLQVLESQFSSKASPPKVHTAQLNVSRVEEVEVPAGAFQAYRVELEVGDKPELLWFEQEFPHRLLRWEAANGDRLELRASKKLPYWRLNKLGDETHLP